MKLFFANWKMYLAHDQELNFVRKNLDKILDFSNLVLCPSFLSLAQIREISDNARSPILATLPRGEQGPFVLSVSKHTNSLQLAAQNCSANNLGAYTSEVAVESLKELRINYCIIGHIEVRQNFGETKENIAKKVLKLLENNITPVICIGETREEKLAGNAKDKFKKEIEFYKNCEIDLQKCFIAYEPVWAIGLGLSLEEPIRTLRPSLRQGFGGQAGPLVLSLTKGQGERVENSSSYVRAEQAERVEVYEQLQKDSTVLPKIQELEDIINYLKDLSQTKILYGGGITSANISEFNKISALDGYLIGKASTNFDELKKIIQS